MNNKNKQNRSMEVKILDQNGEKVVVIEGRVDTVTASDLEMKVSQIWSTPAIKLVFDCEKLESFFVFAVLPNVMPRLRVLPS